MRRITYANLMSTLAVFVALGGASYAVVVLPSNSVGTKQVKDRSLGVVDLSRKAAKALRGQTGPPGERGATGAAGATGPAGSNGTNGTKGDKGDTGAAGAQWSTSVVTQPEAVTASTGLLMGLSGTD